MLHESLRYSIVHAYGQCKNAARVARNLGVDIKTVWRWVRRHESTGSVTIREGQGRKAAMNEAASDEACDMLLDAEVSGAKEVARRLHAAGLTQSNTPLHRTTITRHAKARAAARGNPIAIYRGKPQRQLSPVTMAKRLAFCKANRTTNWSRVMFTDRKKFLLKYPGSKVKRVQWVQKGQKPVADIVNHPMAFNVYAGITKYGMTKVHVVAGTSHRQSAFKNKKGDSSRNITSAEYQHVLTSTLLPEGKKMFNRVGMGTWVLQQDNDPSHKKASIAATAAWNQGPHGNHVSVLADWPPNSPDLNIIENVWAWVQAEVDAKGCKSFNEFEQCVVQTIKNVPREMVQNLYKTMKDRINGCIRLDGAKTRY
jgi:DDE superfamily endonuclease